MKTTLLLSVIFFALSLDAKPKKIENLRDMTKEGRVQISEELAHLQFQKGSVRHQYWIKSTGNGKADLIFQVNKHKPQVKKVSLDRAQSMARNLSSLYWESQARKPANAKNCTPYAQLKVEGEKTAQICLENTKVTGKLYGMFTELLANFK